MPKLREVLDEGRFLVVARRRGTSGGPSRGGGLRRRCRARARGSWSCVAAGSAGGSSAISSIGSSSSSFPDTESLNSRMPLPSWRPISGRRFGPKTRSRTSKRIRSSQIPIPNGMRTGYQRGFRGRRTGDGRSTRGLVRLPSDDVGARASRLCADALIETRTKDASGIARDHEPARRPGGRHRDREGCRPRGRHEREARDHGPERLGQVHARVRAHGSPRLRDHRGRHPPRRRVDPRAGGGRACAARPLPRVPVPARDPRGDGDELPAQRDQREAQGGERRRGGPGPGQGVPDGAPLGDGAPQGAARARAALSERRVLGRREEARRDPPDGDAEAAHRDPRRDRLGSRHRRAADRRRGRQRARRARTWARS